ncbi:ImmA/IrrE family metallo-endopeptidase [Schaalia sp. ZJ405]|uniref:ImmA/IrrE family metallo-endopeptidase n=1 Tax=Schaalia sp. ZJ405 TaxID=2709403 RepID=UPI0013EA1F9B|nr:ImmA/IrrE family metallo-endopeptidase [Schaalia sp. ZJ405]QPK80784.1 ImmA/IrrE family metallo-endopeptidase [Schaalia sp. ZJ405]
MWHPWRALRERTDLALVWTNNLPMGVLGVTDGQRIYMTPRQLQAERRCTLTHELVHVERGHEGCQPVAVERQVCVEAARRLIEIDSLVDAVVWGRSPEEIADELWVDVDTLLVRLDSLTERERILVNEALAARDGVGD